MRTGTGYFTSITRAELYYKPYHYRDTRAAVMQKLKDGEIHLGRPPLKPGETCQPDNEGRYHITKQEDRP